MKTYENKELTYIVFCFDDIKIIFKTIYFN